MKKRLFSILTALCLCLTLLPTAALAANGTGVTYTPADADYVLGQVVKNSTVSDSEKDQKCDVDGDGQFTSWDAKLILDTLPTEPTSLTLDHTNLEMWTGGQVQLHASISPANVYDQGIIWETSDPSVATVKNGLVTAVAGGDATITAASKVNPAVKQECKIKVTSSEDLPQISVKAMRIKGNSADWVDLTIQDDGALKTTVMNEFIGTLRGIYAAKSDNGYSPDAGTLCGGKLMLQVSYTQNGKDVSDLVQVDPDSFAAPEMNVGQAGDWNDVTALSDGRLLGIFSPDRTVFSLQEDGKEAATGSLEQSALGGSVLVGIASAGKDSSSAEVLYGLTKDGALYRIPVTMDFNGTVLEPGTPEKVGENNIIPDSYTTGSNNNIWWLLDSASLLYVYDKSEYLLASATYYGAIPDKYQSVVYLIDLKQPGFYVPMRVYDEEGELDTASTASVFTSLYQYKQTENAAGVQLYVDETPITLKAGGSAALPEAEAYSFSTDEAGLVTNKKLDNAVEWASSDTDVATVKDGVITGVKEGTATIRARVIVGSNDPVYKDISVKVNPNKGMKVDAMIETSEAGGTVLVNIDLDAANSGGILTGVKKVKENMGDTYTGGGYAREKLWGIKETELYPFDPITFTLGNSVKATKDRNVVDLTGAPETTVTYTKDGNTQTVTDPASLVYVTSDGLLGLLNGTIQDAYGTGYIREDYDGTDIYKLSAITYAGDLQANQVRHLFTGKSYLENCDDNAACHVYYALTKDAQDGATLRQLILVPQVGEDNTLTYTLCGSTIGTVKEFDDIESYLAVTSKSMDLWRDGDDYGLLVARSNSFGDHSIWYIDLSAGIPTTRVLKAEEKGVVTGTSLGCDSVNNITGLYHTEDMTLDYTRIYNIAGWPVPQSLTGAMLSASPRAASNDQSTIPVTITSSTRYGKWTLTYPENLTFDSVDVGPGILYKAYSHDEVNRTIALAFATHKDLDFDASKPVFTVNFTTADSSASADDVAVTQEEFNTITVEPNENGTVTVTPSASALVGSTVTLTAKANEGYMLRTITVTDENGKNVELTAKANGEYTFTMPGVQVTVDAVFVAVGDHEHSFGTAWTHNETQHWHACTGCTEKQDAAAHDFQWKIDKAATTAETGLKHEECTVCGAVRSEGTVIDKLPSGGSGGSSGGSGSSSYPVTVPGKTENGSVSVSPKNPSKGDTVTITVKPDSGYTLETVTVTDKNGNELKLTDKGNGKYSFTMPGGKVEVKATFMEDNSVLNFFYDVPNDAYYYEAVKWAAENGVTGGVGNDLFAPNRPCTRAQIVTFLWRAAGSPVVNYLMPFTDVDEGAYYAEAVRWAASTGIVTGLTETTFGTNDVCTRAQATAMIYRYAQAQGKGFTGAWMFLLPFTDVPEWAYESVAWCYMNGVTTGVSETAFAPGNDCTRAQIVTFLWRAFSK